MSNMQSFFMWLIDELPSFLMAEPIIYFVGILFGGIVLKLMLRIINY